MSIQLEICAYSLEACMAAQRARADRVELCENPAAGGTTSGHGLTRIARERLDIGLVPIVRPRPGNFVYSDDTFAMLLEDVRHFRELGCNGVSVGVLSHDGTVDVERMLRIREAAGTLSITCNRAFDLTPDPFVALEYLVQSGCNRILTSGQARFAHQATALLGRLVQQAGKRIRIMPGSGVRPDNLRQLLIETGAREVHTSARKQTSCEQTRPGSKLLELGVPVDVDETMIRHMRTICDTFQDDNCA